MRLAAAAAVCDPDATDSVLRYGPGMSPTQLNAFGSRALGALVANACIAIAAVLVGFGVTLFARSVGSRCAPKLFEELDAQGVTKFPSAPLTVFQILYQGTTLASMELVLEFPSTALFFVGWVGVIFCATVPFIIFRCISRDVPSRAVYQHDPSTHPVLAFFIGKGEWLSQSRHPHWIERWSSCVRPYAPHVPWFGFIEYASSFTISAIQSAIPTTLTGCGHVKLFSGIVFIVLLGLETRLWPHACARNGMLDVMILGGQAAAMFTLAAGYYSGDMTDSAFGVGATLLFYAMVVLLARTALDILQLLYVFVSGRRRKLQAAQFERNAKENHAIFEALLNAHPEDAECIDEFEAERLQCLSAPTPPASPPKDGASESAMHHLAPHLAPSRSSLAEELLRSAEKISSANLVGMRSRTNTGRFTSPHISAAFGRGSSKSVPTAPSTPAMRRKEVSASNPLPPQTHGTLSFSSLELLPVTFTSVSTDTGTALRPNAPALTPSVLLCEPEHIYGARRDCRATPVTMYTL
eukprot:TRINITY_DN1018_c0_g1_i1.p1 TRINITY_DN1018_c0_g1~~TRINITY_DN1018_c0_g1_i1.p1  ORF type:complete len:615 (+),score=59.42 TRINITY_DN1018_c0_g1_i1:274-1845(+)